MGSEGQLLLLYADQRHQKEKHVADPLPSANGDLELRIPMLPAVSWTALDTITAPSDIVRHASFLCFLSRFLALVAILFRQPGAVDDDERVLAPVSSDREVTKARYCL